MSATVSVPVEWLESMERVAVETLAIAIYSSEGRLIPWAALASKKQDNYRREANSILQGERPAGWVA